MDRVRSRLCSFRTLPLLIGALMATHSVSAQASGFQLFEYSGAAIGNYGAGGAAEADDATTAYTNPAGMVRLQAPTMSASAIGVWGQADFKGVACGGALCTPMPAHKDGGTYATVPAFEMVLPINDVLSAGLSVTVPFGLSTNYGHRSVLAYSASKSALSVLDIGPSMGVKVTKKLSVGFGLDIQEMSATLNQDVNVNPATLPDAYAKNTANDWALGWNASALFQFTDATRFGFNFHSHVNHDLSGTSHLYGGLYQPASSHLTASVDLPAYTMFSGFHQFNQQWSMMGTVTYTNWNQDALTLKNTQTPRSSLNPLILATQTQTSTVVLPQNYNGTWREALGVDYQMTPHWRFRVGGGHDSTPTNDTDRSIRLGDADRYALAAGARYTINQIVSIDAGYTHFFIEDGKINQQGSLSKSIGDSDNAGNVFGLQLNLTAA